MRIAIIGSGISGLGAAYLLAPHHDIVVYEKNSYVGGHARTIQVPSQGHSVPVDTGFIVFNDWNYPNLQALFDTLKVPYQKSNMSFGVSIQDGWLEYSSNGLFAQRRNLFRPSYWGMINDIVRFNNKALHYIDKNSDITLQECMDQLKMSEWFRQYYLLAMGAAIWSCPVETIMEFPARTFLQFFKNHGLLSLNNRPQWYTVSGGSQEYIKRLTAGFLDKIKCNCGVAHLKTEGNRVIITDERSEIDVFDHVIFACHADEAIAIMDNPEPYQSIIGSFRYQKNDIIVHKDTSFMPHRRECWASWIYLSENKNDHKEKVSLSYWMNNLQEIDTDYPVLVTLNPGRRPQEDMILDEHSFTHPIFDMQAIDAQDKIEDIQGKNGIWFCGAYQRYGFHEDGLMSALNVVEKLGVKIPWK